MDRDPEALRRRLYRPGASAADLAVYLQATEEDRAQAAPDPEAPTAPSSGPSLRPFVIGGAVVAAGALLGAVLLTSAPRTAAPITAPTVAAATASTDGDGPTWRVTFSETQILDGGPITHAEGMATQEGSQMYRYVVTVGDTVAAIADRFGICQADVTDALPYGADPAELADGQGLELSRSESNEC